MSPWCLSQHELLRSWDTKRCYSPRRVKPLAQSDTSSRTNRSNGAEKYPSPVEGVPGLSGGEGGREDESSCIVTGDMA